MQQISLMLLFISLPSWAVDTIKPMQDLSLHEGYYSVVSRQDEDCVPGEFKWHADEQSSTLVLGPRLFFAPFNKNGSLEISPYAEGCKFKSESRSYRQNETGFLELDEEQVCSWGNSKAHHVVTVKGANVRYTQERSSTNIERVAPLKVDCKFVRMVPQPKINPPPSRKLDQVEKPKDSKAK